MAKYLNVKALTDDAHASGRQVSKAAIEALNRHVELVWQKAKGIDAHHRMGETCIYLALENGRGGR